MSNVKVNLRPKEDPVVVHRQVDPRDDEDIRFGLQYRDNGDGTITFIVPKDKILHWGHVGGTIVLKNES